MATILSSVLTLAQGYSQHSGGVGLIGAIQHRDWERAQLILDSHPDVNVRDPDTAVTPLTEAIYAHNNDFVTRLLSAGADPNFESGVFTPLGAAASVCDLQIATTLLDHGALVDLKQSVDHWTPLRVASERCGPRFLQFLLKAGADPDVTSDFGDTALMEAALSPNLSAAKVLIEAGADPFTKDDFGQTAKDRACNLHWPANHIEEFAQMCAFLRNLPRKSE